MPPQSSIIYGAGVPQEAPMNLSFEDYNAARAACVIAARHEGEKAFQMEGSDREELLSSARRFRELANRLAQVNGPSDAT
jgi:hypothetical protein